MESRHKKDLSEPRERLFVRHLLLQRRENKVRNVVKIKTKSHIKRKLRWERYRRKKTKRRPDNKLDLRNVNFYKPGLQPPYGENLALRIIKIRERYSTRRLPAWIVLVRSAHQRRNTQSNSVVFSAFINYDLNLVNLKTQETSITPEQIRNGARYEQIRENLKSFIKNYKLISHELSDDLSCFNLLDRYHLCTDLSTRPQGFYDKNSKPIDLEILNWVVNKKKIKTKVRSAISEANAIMQAFHKLERGYIKSQIDETGQHSFHWIVIKAKKEKE